MVFTTAKSMLRKAKKGGYAVGAFNTSNLELTKAIIGAAEELNAPVMVQASTSAIKYAGIKEMVAIVKTIASQTKIPVALHLDHGPNFDWAKKCIQNGFSSVMIDSSSLPFKENVATTKKVVNYAHKYRVPVEAEIGRLQGIEDNVKVSAKDSMFTDVNEAYEFYKKTGCDSLAVAVGTSHGAYKFKGSSELDYNRIKEISERLPIPIVLHGASAVPQWVVKKAEKYGADLGNAKGLAAASLKKAVKAGINKVNTDTDLRLAFDAGIREHLAKNPKDFNPRSMIEDTYDELYKVITDRIKLLGSEGQA